jgi:hypothetical protein
MTAARKIPAGKFDRAKALAIIYAGVAGGRAIDAILAEDKNMPPADTFWRWHMEDETIRDDLARARECGVERHVGEIVSIADEVTDNAASRKVRIDARLKVAHMIAPRKYGARPDPAGGGDQAALAAEVEAGRRRIANAR